MDWESLGDVSWSLWRATLADVGSLILDEGPRAYETAKPHSALCLAVMERTTRYATGFRDFETHHNPFALQLGGSFPGLVAFDSWSDAIEHWKEHALPYYDNFGEQATWSLANRVAELQERDRTGVIGLAVPGYLDDAGNPTEETWRSYFEADAWYAHTNNQRVVVLWKKWCLAHGVFPSILGFFPKASGTEFEFDNGLRVYDDGTTARIVGNPEFSK